MKVSNEGQELIILLILGCILYGCIVTDTVYEIGHDILQKTGISQKIEQFESNYYAEK